MLGFIPIMIATIIFNTVYAQMSTVFVEQVRLLTPFLHFPRLLGCCVPYSELLHSADCLSMCAAAVMLQQLTKEVPRSS